VTRRRAAVAVDASLTVRGARAGALSTNAPPSRSVPTATYTVTSTEVTREGYLGGLFPARLAVGYAGIEDLTLNTGGPVCLVNVTSLPATPVTVNLSGAVNVVTVGDGGNSLDSIAGPLTIHGSGGQDALTLNDQGNAVSQVYNVTTDRVTRAISPGGTPPSVSITYDAIESLSLNTGSGGNIVHVVSTAAITSTTVTSQPGALDIF